MKRLLLTAFSLLTFAGCSSSPGNSVTSAPPTVTDSATSVNSVTPHKVMVILFENHSRDQALAGMPYLASAADTYGQATNYEAVAHPSLQNYLAIVGGSTFGITDDQNPSSYDISGDSVFDTTIASGQIAKTYAESMPSRCYAANDGPYVVRHNPWPYFQDSASNCDKFDLPMGTPTAGRLRYDINNAALPVTGLMVPDVCNDAHNCSLSVADDWLRAWVNKLKNGPDYQDGDLTIIITFDEDDFTPKNQVPFVVIDPRLHSDKVTVEADHYALTRWLCTNAGVTPLRNAADATHLRRAFGL